MFRFILITIAAFIIAITMRAEASEPAERLVETTALSVLQSDSSTNANTALNAIDFDALARFTLGRHGRSLEQSEYAAFRTALRAWVGRAYEDQFGRFRGAELTVLGSIERNAKDSIVRTRVSLPGNEPLSVNWRVMNRSGEWKLVDVEFQGVWLAIEQRAQFAAILDRPGANINTVISALNG